MSWTHRSFWQPLLVGLLVVGILGWPTRGQARKRPKPKASSSALQTVDLGTRPIHDTGGESGELTVEIPEGAVSAIVHCGGFGDTALGSVWHLVDPTGKVVWDGELRQNEGFRSDFVDDWAVAVLPQSPRAPLIPGTYTVAFWVGADNLGSARCGAIIRSHPVTPEPTFKLEFVFVGLEGMTAATAPENKGFQKFIAAFEEDLSRGKVAVDYTLKDFEGDVPRFTVVDVADDDMAEFNALLTHAHPQEPTAITVFLVQEIANSTAGGATILGMSAGPPGAATLQGTSKSGLVVTTRDLDRKPTDVARILSHELGHFLGLFHTTEKNGKATDLLVDTPECKHDPDKDGIMGSDECHQDGASNTMWWTLRPLASEFSEEQSWVIARSPAAQ